MPRALDLSTSSAKKHLARLAAKVEKGEIDYRRGTSAANIWKAIIYGNQVEAHEKQLELDERLALNMERLKEVYDHGGELPDYEIEEAEYYEAVTESQGVKSISGGLSESNPVDDKQG